MGNMENTRRFGWSIASRPATFVLAAWLAGAACQAPDAGVGEDAPPKPSVVPSLAGAPPHPQIAKRARVSPIAPGEVIVKLASDDDAAELALRRVSPGGTLLHRRSGALEQAFARHGVRDATRLLSAKGRGTAGLTFRLSSRDVDPSLLIAELRATPGVVYAEPNRVHTLAYAPNDPYFQSSGAWGQSYPDLWGLSKIAAPAAWDATFGAGVVVAVVDSGVDYGHPDLTANIWQNPGETGTDAQGHDKRTNGVDDDGNGFIDDWRGYNFASASPLAPNDPMDDLGHGTHVAGTIGAVGDNAIGVVGVAPSSKIMAIKAFAQDGTATDADLANAIHYAAANGARVINASWGTFSDTPDLTIIDAVDEAHDTYGAIVVASAGNGAIDLGNEIVPGTAFYPAAALNAVAVGATTHLDEIASFSDYGKKLDVMAPGGGDGDVGLVSPERSILSLLSAKAAPGFVGGGVVGTRYLRQGGTSMSAPHVSGVAALVLASHPGATPEQVRQAIRAGSDDIGDAGWDAHAGYGRVNAARAVAIAQPLSAQLTGPAALPIGSARATVTGSAAGNGFADYRLELGAGDAPTSWTQIVTSSTPVAQGTLADWDLTGVPNGSYTLRLVSESVSGAVFEDRLPITIRNVAIEFPAPEEHAVFAPGQQVPISGLADADQFMSFTVTVEGATTGPVPSGAITLVNGGAVPEQEQILAYWDTTGLATDHYTITLSVASQDGSVRLAQSAVIIDAALHPGWPVRSADPSGVASGPTELSFGPSLVDVDGDGAADLVSGSGRFVQVLRHDGTALPGWPQMTDEPLSSTLAPVAGDITGDGSPEVIASSSTGVVSIWRSDGSILLGWPRQVSAVGVALALADLNKDGAKDIVIADYGAPNGSTGGSIIVLDHDTTTLPGWPQTLDRPLSKPVVGDVDGDGTSEVVITSLDGASAYVLGADGRMKAGWPKVLSAAPLAATDRMGSIPALADIDGDGKADIVVGSADGKVVAWHGDGTVVAGWPQTVACARASSPAIGDIDGDGRLDVVVGCSPTTEGASIVDRIYAWHGDGTALAGWPVRYAPGLQPGGFGFGAPALADIDGDGKADVVVTSDAGSSRAYALHALRATGVEVTGFPRPTPDIGGGVTDAPVIGDMDGDGALELAWLGRYRSSAFDGALTQLLAYDLSAPKTAAQPWPMFACDAGKAGFVKPAGLVAPPPPSLVALPRAGWRAMGSNATGTAAALDGDATTRWSTGTAQRNGEFFEVDFGAPLTFSRVTLDSHGTANDFPVGYEVYVSNDGVTWGAAVAKGAGTGDLVVIDFAPQTARYLRVVQTGSSSTWWSIYEINVYGPPPSPVALVRNGWSATASLKSSTAGSAVDGSSSTRWTTGAAQASGQWWQVDLRAASTISAIVLDSGGYKSDYPRGYEVRLSTDGATWTAPVATGTGAQSPLKISFPEQAARYVRITQTGSASNWWSIVELGVYGPPPPPPAPAALARTGWSAKASQNTSSASAALDGSSTSRWTTGIPQASGQYFQLDLGAKRSFSQLVLENAQSANDYPRAYQVFVSADGEKWGSAIATGVGAPRTTTISFVSQSARFVRVVLTASSSAWWSIHEIGAAL
jgi:subtilisin family serine protease